MLGHGIRVVALVEKFHCSTCEAPPHQGTVDSRSGGDLFLLLVFLISCIYQSNDDDDGDDYDFVKGREQGLS